MNPIQLQEDYIELCVSNFQTQRKQSYIIPPASVEAACEWLAPSWEYGHYSGGSQGLARPAESPGLGTSLPVTVSKPTSLTD